MPDEPKTIHAERITIYDSVHIPPGEKLPERITFSFGADAEGPNEEYLAKLGESEIIEQVLATPVLLQRLLAFLDIEYPNCWIVTEIMTKDVSRSWPHSKPGDLDLICGNMRDGRPDFNYIGCAQIKIRKVKTLADSGDFASGSRNAQGHGEVAEFVRPPERVQFRLECGDGRPDVRAEHRDRKSSMAVGNGIAALRQRIMAVAVVSNPSRPLCSPWSAMSSGFACCAMRLLLRYTFLRSTFFGPWPEWVVLGIRHAGREEPFRATLDAFAA